MVEMMNYDYDTSDVVGGFRKDFVNVVNVSGRASDNTKTMPRFALANLRAVIMGEAEVNENNFAILSTSDKELFISSDTHDDESFKKETGWVLKNRDREWTIAIKIKCNLPFWKMKSLIRDYLHENNMWLFPNPTKGAVLEMRQSFVLLHLPISSFRKGITEKFNDALTSIFRQKNSEFRENFRVSETYEFDCVVCLHNNFKVNYNGIDIKSKILVIETPKNMTLLYKALIPEATILMNKNEGKSIFIAAPVDLRNSRRHANGPKLIAGSLSAHNNRLSQLDSIKINGISRDAMEMMRPKFYEKCSKIEMIDSTFNTDEHGRWSVLVMRDNIEEVETWFDANLASEYLPVNLEFKGHFPSEPYRMQSITGLSKNQNTLLEEIANEGFSTSTVWNLDSSAEFPKLSSAETKNIEAKYINMEQTIKNIKESTEKMQEELAELSKVTEGLRHENKSLREEMNQLKLDLEVKLKRERIDAEEKYKLELDSLRSETFMRFTTNEASIENNFKNTVKNAAIIEAHGDDIVELDGRVARNKKAIKHDRQAFLNWQEATWDNNMKQMMEQMNLRFTPTPLVNNGEDLSVSDSDDMEFEDENDVENHAVPTRLFDELSNSRDHSSYSKRRDIDQSRGTPPKRPITRSSRAIKK